MKTASLSLGPDNSQLRRVSCLTPCIHVLGCASTGQRYLVLSCSRVRSYVFPGSAILYCLSTRVLDLPIKLLA